MIIKKKQKKKSGKQTTESGMGKYLGYIDHPIAVLVASYSARVVITQQILPMPRRLYPSLNRFFRLQFMYLHR
jgi:hypothetical protein